MMPRLHILGAGRAARTLARLWRDSGVLDIGQVRNRSLASAEQAADWIGAGTAVERFADVDRDDWIMLGVPDSQLARSVTEGVPRVALAFHLSGAESSRVLEGIAGSVAAVHPVCAFAEPDLALGQFPGRFAVGEGDEAALDRLLPCFEAIGARAFRFAPKDKRLYHAAMISASNFLCTLDQLAEDLAVASGLEAAQARHLITSLQMGALETIADRGGCEALTGPIERGDFETCEAMMMHIRREAAARPEFSRRVLPLVSALAVATVNLAQRKRTEQEEDLEILRPIFLERAD
jgi:predicted short-subunit dehydrogenase-like oxidoreductase (DUF2520 family)